MKVDARSVEGFLRRPDPATAIVLLYGQDDGLVQERGRLLAATVIEDLADPFRVSLLADDMLREDPGRLADEARSLCLMGGRRLVRVRPAAEATAAALDLLLAAGPVDAFVLLEAGDLAKTSKLLQLAERAPGVAAIPCWRETEARLPSAIRALLQERGLTADAATLASIASLLGADRGLAKAELDKLALYKLGTALTVTLADLTAIMGDASAVALDDAVLAALTGDAARLQRELARLAGDGVRADRLLRVLGQQLANYLRMTLAMQAGADAAGALARARPPIHFSLRDRALAALRRHDPTTIAAGIAAVHQAEAAIRGTRAPAELVAQRLFSRLAGSAARNPVPTG